MSDSSEENIDVSLFAELQQTAGLTQEQRRHARHQKSGRIHLHVAHQRQPLIAQLRDVSVGGIGLIFREAMDAGTSFSVQFATDDGSRSIKYKVVRCRRLERGRYEIGAEIIHVSREKKNK